MYSLELRKMIINIYNHFKSLRKTANLTNISKSTIQRWIHNVIPKTKSQRISKLNKPIIIQIIESLIQTNPFITLLEIKAHLYKFLKLNVSSELIRLFVKKQLGKSFKNAHFYPLPNETNLINKISEFKKEHLEQFPNSLIVSLDEVGFSSNVRQLKGWNKKGTKLQIKYRPLAIDKKRTSVCSLITSLGQIQYSSISGFFNGDHFMNFIKTLDFPPNSIIILDNVSFHHSKVFNEYALIKNWKIIYSPPYSPQFNPIELIFSKVKRSFRKHRNIEESFNSISSEHITNVIQHVINQEILV